MRFRSGVRAVSRRKRLTGAHAARPSSNQGLKVAVAVAAPILVAALLITLVAANDKGNNGSDTSASSTTTVTASKEQQAFSKEVDDAFRPLADAVQAFLMKTQDFEAGKASPADLKGAIDVALPEFVKARDAVARLRPYKKDPIVNRYFLDAADFYVEVVRIYDVAIDPGAETLRGQLTTAARRVRTLGDRIYDRGKVVLDPTFYPAPTENVEVRPPTEVPDWVAEGMAAGPPLAEAPGPPAATLPERQATCAKNVPTPCRAEQSEKTWVSRVKDAGFAQPSDVAKALEDADAAKLGDLAAAYETKTRTLMAGPDPKGKRERAAAAGLGLLTAGESARLGQAAALLPAGDARGRLQQVARRVLVVADDLLQPGLGFRPSGLPQSLLQDTGL